MDRIDFAKIMRVIAESFGAEISDILVETWFRLATEDGITKEAFADAAKTIIRTREIKAMPTYAEILKLCNGDVQDKALSQANHILAMIRQRGIYNPPSWDDPATKALMSSRWTWRELCAMEASKTPFWVRDFCAAYASAATHQPPVREAIAGPGNDRIRLLVGGIGKGA